MLKYRRKLAETNGPTSLGNEVGRCRVVLNFAFQNGLIEKPVRYGEFKRPKKAALRRARAAKGSRLFEPWELRKLYYSLSAHLDLIIFEFVVRDSFGGKLWISD